MKRAWTYFNEKEDPLIVGLDTELMAKLDAARGKSGVPFVITSGTRTPEHNAQLIGSVCGSAHLTGLAVDLACQDDHMLFSMISGLVQAGFRRYGIYVAQCSDNPTKLVPRHIHADIDPDKPLDDTWVMIERN